MMGAGSVWLWALTELCADEDEIGEHGDVAQRDDEAHHVPSVLPSDRHDPEPDGALLPLLRLVRDRELAQPLCAARNSDSRRVVEEEKGSAATAPW